MTIKVGDTVTRKGNRWRVLRTWWLRGRPMFFLDGLGTKAGIAASWPADECELEEGDVREHDWMIKNRVPKEERLPGLWPQYEDGLLTVRKQGDSYFITKTGPYTNVLLIRKSELQRLIALLQRVEEDM